MSGIPLAVVAAVVAAAAFGLSGVLQHRADRSAPHAALLSPSFILGVVRQPIWLLSIVAVAVAFGGQLLALATAPLVLVQPILVTGVLFAAVFSPLLNHRRPDRLVLLAAFGCAAGLSAFLLLARPGQGGGAAPPPERVWPLAATFGGVLAVTLALAIRSPSAQTRTLALALAAGVLYGLNAGLAKLALGRLADGGVLGLLTGWPLWTIVVIGPLGFLLNQEAFAAGVAVSPAVAVITVTDPLVSLGVGVSWLGESVQASPARIAGEVAALAVIVVAVAVLARAAPRAVAGVEPEPTRGQREQAEAP